MKAQKSDLDLPKKSDESQKIGFQILSYCEIYNGTIVSLQKLSKTTSDLTPHH
jgi:hypothetical protein